MNPFLLSNSNSLMKMKLPDVMLCQNNLQNFSNLPNFQNLSNGPVFQKIQNSHNLPQFNTLNNLQNLQNLSNIPSLSNQNIFFSNPTPTPRPVQPSLPENMANMLNLVLNNPQMNQELQHQLTNIFVSWKTQNNLQNELYKSQMSQLVEMQNRLITLKTLAVEATNSSPKTAASESQRISPEHTTMYKPEPKLMTQVAPKKTLKNQIRALVHFMLKSFGRVSESQFEQEKNNYRDNDDLLAVFEALMEKYTSTIKTKEEMIKYTLRKAFKFIKSELKKEMQVDAKEASAILCKRYFEGYTGQLPDFKDEDDFLQFVLPFRKSSKNKTMNSSFITEVFASVQFCKDYNNYLEDLDDILESDNNSKIERFVGFIEECMKKKKIQDIKKYKRIPWPELWILNTRKIALELPTANHNERSSNQKKQIKAEYNGESGSSSGSFASGLENEDNNSFTVKIQQS